MNIMDITVKFRFGSKRYRIHVVRFTIFLLCCALFLYTVNALTTHPRTTAVSTVEAAEVEKPKVEPKKEPKAEPKEEKAEKVEEEPIEAEEPSGEEMPVMSDSSVKRYMDRDMVTDTSTENYRICNILAESQDNGTIEVDGRTVVALGQSYGKVGDKFDITLDSGNVLNVIIGDSKRYCDTEDEAGYIASDGSLIEFVVNTSQINEMSRVMGDMNYTDELSGRIVKIVKVN